MVSFLQLAAEKKTQFLTQLKQIFRSSYFDRALVIDFNLFIMKFCHVPKFCKLFWWRKILEPFVSNLFVSFILGCYICDTRLWTQNASSLYRSTSNILVQTKEFFRKSLLYQRRFRWFIFVLRFLRC